MPPPCREVIQAAGLQCLLQKPSMAAPPWPLVLFLHGAGERGHGDGRDLSRVSRHGPWRAPAVVQGCLLVAPQCPSGKTWPSYAKELVRLVGNVGTHYPVDARRRYITGISMGAFGAWAAAAAAPNIFAAIVPICGGFSAPLPKGARLLDLRKLAKATLDAAKLSPLRHMPAWLFHGGLDKVVDVNGSIGTAAVLRSQKRMTRSVRLTIYKGRGHVIWGPAYRHRGLWSFLLQARRRGGAEGAQGVRGEGVGEPAGRALAGLANLGKWHSRGTARRCGRRDR